jgi:hypothetical protein
LIFIDAKLEKIHPPIYWKSLDYKQKNIAKIKSRKINQRSCSDGYYYTALTGNEFRVFIDFEHDGLQHSTWKELIEQKHLQIKSKPSIIEHPWLNLNNKQQSLNDQRQELDRYFKLHIEKDNLFELDTSSYPNRPKPISRRPHDALHIDFYQADSLKGSKTEATFKTFYHLKYLVNKLKIIFSKSCFLFFISYLDIYVNVH